MPDPVGVNFLTVVHKASNGITAAFPDICLTPAPPAGPIPIPYPNIARSSDSSDESKTVNVGGNPVCVSSSKFSRSSGDEAGTNKGMVSGQNMGPAEFINYSFDVKIEGKGVPRAFDLMLHNGKNTPPFPLIQPPVFAIPIILPSERKEWALEEIQLD